MTRLIVFIALISTLNFSYSQRYFFDMGIKVGASNYLGDMGGKELPRRDFVLDMKMKHTRWDLGIFARYRANYWLAVRGDVTYTRIEGKDIESTNPGRRGRNLSFKNDMIALEARAEFYPPFLSVSDVGYYGRYRADYQTYVYAGAGALFHFPFAELGGEKYYLRPLMTEGFKYSVVTLTVPVGAGFFFTLRRQHRIGFEIQWNWTLTDYLDDVSNVYVDPSMMGSDAIASTLANRRSELNEAFLPDPANYDPGNKRGDKTHLDNYLSVKLYYSYVFRQRRGGFQRRNYSWMYGRRGRFRKVKAKL
ncbi:MAG: hypothetical protein KDC56_06545 [Flavobacteriaceae bacterium]|nr:hypothetical protein [Flavobacteriaceae bacterium]